MRLTGLIILSMIFGLAGYGEDFSFLKPPSTFFEKEGVVDVAGEKIKTYVFQTTLSEREVLNFYDKTLAAKGFTKFSQTEAFLDSYEYSRDKQTISIKTAKLDNGNKGVTVIASVYDESYCTYKNEGCPSCGEGNSSLTPLQGGTSPDYSDYSDIDEINEDFPGEDLEFIPRPPQSVRVINFKTDNPFTVNIIYNCKDSREELKNFYKQNMDYHYWKLVAEFSSDQVVEELNRLKLINIPRNTPSSLEALKSAYNLYFKGPYGEATVVIMESPYKEDERMVTILYRRK